MTARSGAPPTVRIAGLWKKYCRTFRRSVLHLGLDFARNLVGRSSWDGLRPQEFWSLQDISLELHRGTSLGVIGPNGSGKSTLLKMLSGIFEPTRGRIEVCGRVGALIEVGAGFHRDLTGWENIYLNGAVLGMTWAEITEKLDAIVAFAGIGDFLDAPVKTYSSGMFVRLGFAVAIHADPDLLLVDEVLAVGDIAFRHKCLQKINALREHASVVFVTHNMRDVTLFCDRALVLDKGRCLFDGDPREAVSTYVELMEEAVRGDERRGRTYCGEMFNARESITDVAHEWVDASGRRLCSVNQGEPLSLRFSFHLLRPVRRLVLGVPLWDEQGMWIMSPSSDIAAVPVEVGADGRVAGHLDLDYVILNPGDFFSVFSVFDGSEPLYRQRNDDLEVKGPPNVLGLVTPRQIWRFDAGTGGVGGSAERGVPEEAGPLG